MRAGPTDDKYICPRETSPHTRTRTARALASTAPSGTAIPTPQTRAGRGTQSHSHSTPTPLKRPTAYAHPQRREGPGQHTHARKATEYRHTYRDRGRACEMEVLHPLFRPFCVCSSSSTQSTVLSVAFIRSSDFLASPENG